VRGSTGFRPHFGLPKTIVLSTVEIREAIEEPTASIVDRSGHVDQTPPELRPTSWSAAS
jgi:actin-like ATPase involved in cell morphogenesis